MLNIFVQDDQDPGRDGPQQTQFEPVGDGGQGQGREAGQFAGAWLRPQEDEEFRGQGEV